MSNYLEAAIKLANNGYEVFQCAAGSKTPFYNTAPHGCNSATTDKNIITDIWTKYPDCNIAIKCSNLLVFDVDVRDGSNGSNDLRNVIDVLGDLPPSPIVITGSGGWHLFFAKPDIDVVAAKHVKWQGQNTNIDIQTGNQYIIAPPSIHPNGTPYTWYIQPCHVANLPTLPTRWITDFLSLRKIKNKLFIPTPLSQLQTDHNAIERCRAYLHNVEPCIAGQGGDRQLFKVACIIFWDFGLTESDGMQLLREYNLRCQPPWSQSRLEYKMHEALKYKHENPKGHLLNQSLNIQYDNVDTSDLIQNLSLPLQSCNTESDLSCPERLIFIPGFIEKLVQFCLQSAPHPNRILAFCGAIALMSFLITRKVQTQTGIRPNLYIIALAGSGTGKDFIRKVNHFILESIGQSQFIGESIASGEGLEEMILANKKMLYQTDEIQTLFSEIATGKESRYNNIVAFLLKVYTSADSAIIKRTKVDAKKSIGNITCNQPGLILFGTTIPEIFFDVLTPTMMMTGLGSRCLFIEGETRQPYNHNACDHRNVPKVLIEIAQWWKDFIPPDPVTGKVGNMSDENPSPLVVSITNDARKILNSLGEQADFAYTHTRDAIEQVLWTRVYEIASKLALIYACSANHLQPVIDYAAAKWASEFTDWIIRQMMKLVSRHVAESQFAKLALRAEGLIRKRGGFISRNDLSRAMHLRPRELDEIIQKLTCEEVIESYVTADTGGRPRVGYRMFK